MVFMPTGRGVSTRDGNLVDAKGIIVTDLQVYWEFHIDRKDPKEVKRLTFSLDRRTSRIVRRIHGYTPTIQNDFGTCTKIPLGNRVIP